MLAIIRVLLLVVGLLIVCIFSSIYSILRPFHRNNVYNTSKYLGKFSKLLGLDVEIRVSDSVKKLGPAVYIANHQNNWDLFTVSGGSHFLVKCIG